MWSEKAIVEDPTAEIVFIAQTFTWSERNQAKGGSKHQVFIVQTFTWSERLILYVCDGVSFHSTDFYVI